MSRLLSLAVSAALLLGASSVQAGEGYDATVPGPAVPVDDSARFVIEQLTLLRPVAGKTAESEPQRRASVFIRFVGMKAGGTCATDSQGNCQRVTVSINDEARAITLMNVLNNANMTSNSLTKRIFGLSEVTDALGAGTVSGSQDLPTLTPIPVDTPTPTPIL